MLADGDRADASTPAPRASHLADERAVFACEPIPGFLLDMVDAGGLLPILERRLKTTRQERP